MPGVTMQLGTGEFSVEPGQEATGELRVRNGSADEAELRFEIIGLARAWGYVSPPQLTVAPGQERTAVLSFRPPRSAGVAPGPTSFEVRVVAADGSASAEIVGGTVDVAPFVEVAASLGAGRVSGRAARHRLVVENRGNVALAASIEAGAAGGGLAVRATVERVELEPGETADVEVAARPRRLRAGPGAAPPPLQVVVRPDGGAAVTVTAGSPGRPRRRGGRLVVGTALAAALVAGYVGTRGDDGGEPAAGQARPAVGVGVRTEALVDTARPTDSHGAVRATPDRRLPTLVYYPSTEPAGATAVEGAPPAVDAGPYPLVVFAHGSSGEVEQRYGDLLRAWAARGYVVAAPTFPFAANPADRSQDDYPNQPADMSFVARELVRLGADPAGPLRGMIDADRIGAAGVALGGITTLGLVGNTCCQDPQFKAAAVMAANRAAFGDGEYFTAPGPPMLVLHGDQDETIPYADARATFGAAPRPAFLVTFLGGGHGDPFIGPVDRPMNAVTFATTLAFFDRYLGGDDQALDRLRMAGDVPGVARVEERD